MFYFIAVDRTTELLLANVDLFMPKNDVSFIFHSRLTCQAMRKTATSNRRMKCAQTGLKSKALHVPKFTRKHVK